MQDNNKEQFPIVDEEGRVVGTATRGECHIGNAPEDRDIIRLPADKSTVDALHGQRLVIMTIGNRLVLAAVHLFQFLSNLM